MSDTPDGPSRWEPLVRLVTAGRGRPAAVAVLALWLGIVFIDPAPVARLRTIMFDVYHIVVPREPEGFPAKVVAIDEASLQAYGQWPWPRTLIAELVEKIAAADPAAIGFDVLFPEIDRYSPAQVADALPQLDAATRTRLANFPANDALLADSFRRFGRVALAKTGILALEAAVTELDPGRLPVIRELGPDKKHLLARYPHILRSIDVLENAAAGWGLITWRPDDDGVVRRVPAVIIVGNQVVPTLSLEMIRVLQRSQNPDQRSEYKLYSEADGYVGIDPGGFPIAIDRDAQFSLHHSRHRPERFVSARTVLESDEPVGELNRRFVLIGATAVGLHDIVTTPLERRMPGAEVHAQVLESLVEDRLLTRPLWAERAELAATVIGGLLLIWLVPILRPGLSFVPLIVLWGAIFTAGWGLFLRGAVLFDTSGPALGNGITFVATLGLSLILAEQRRRILQGELERQERARQYLQAQLDAARDIQMKMLPTPEESQLPEAIDLAARLVPATTVGGDLYDFFMVDERRLFFHIGDVTGKGLDAALFMALSKALCKSVVLRQLGAIDRIMAQANREIDRENNAQMMVTMFAGVLDLESGEIEFVNAGHESPFRLLPGAAPREVDSEGGPPLCALDEFDYPLERLTLAEGEMLVLYTDGVTDARSPGDEMFGRARLADFFAATDPATGAGLVLQRLYDTVDGFVSGADAADDITVLVLRRVPAPR